MYLYYRDKLQVISLIGVLGFRKLHRVETIEPRAKWVDAISEVINNCRIGHTDKWRTWYWNQKYRSFVNPSWEDKYATSRSGMFIYMSALIFNLSFNLIWRIGFFFRSSVKNDFFLCHEKVWNFLSIIMYLKTWNFRHWWSKQYAGWSFMYPLYVMDH